MDGLFVPNISFGMPIVSLIRKMTKKPLDVHLMITKPERYIDKFIDIGSDILTVHIEATSEMENILDRIKDSSIKSGIAINPDTSLSVLDDVVDEIDLILLMSVYPGFGGQEFIEDTIEKIQAARELIDKQDHKIYLEVDGGINNETISRVSMAGADVFVAGSAIFGSSDYEQTIESFRQKIS